MDPITHRETTVSAREDGGGKTQECKKKKKNPTDDYDLPVMNDEFIQTVYVHVEKKNLHVFGSIVIYQAVNHTGANRRVKVKRKVPSGGIYWEPFFSFGARPS